MGYDAKTERLISLKKLAGKAQTSNDKGLANEGLPSGLTVSSNTVFGQAISTSPASVALYNITGQVELVRFPTIFIAGSDTIDGRHGFELKLPSDYESNSSNPGKGTYPFINGQSINITSGSLQLIPTSYSTAYEAKPFYGGSASKGTGTQIPILDSRDWYMDYFNGIMFQQDPPGTGDHSENPDYVEAYLYIGKYLDVVITEAGGTGGADPAAQYLVLQATGSLSAERVFTDGVGIDSSDAGAGAAFTVGIDNSVVATLTGSQFSGNVGVTGSFTVGGKPLPGTDTNFFISGSIHSIGTSIKGTSVFGGDVLASGSVTAITGLTGSLTRLKNGTPYLRSGTGISIVTGSVGEITITRSGSGVSRNKKSYKIISPVSAGVNVSVASSDMSIVDYDPNVIDLLLNGQMLLSGSAAEVSSSDVDYTVSGASSIKFAFDIKIDDLITLTILRL